MFITIIGCRVLKKIYIERAGSYGSPVFNFLKYSVLAVLVYTPTSSK